MTTATTSTGQPDPVDELRRGFTAEVARIRSRRDLSDAGRQRQLAKAYVAARDEMRRLTESDQQRGETRRSELYRRLFGVGDRAEPSAVISARDAADRAERCTKPDDAQQLLARALDTGDRSLAAAVAARAADRSIVSTGSGWGEVLEQWGSAQPAPVVEMLDELMDMLSPQSAQRRLAGAMSRSLTRPSELRGVSNVSQLAREADRQDDDEAEELHPLFDARRSRDRLGRP